MGIKTIQTKRLQALSKQYDWTDSESASRLLRIALLLENQTKLNVRRQRLVDTGNLLNSIRGEARILNTDEATIEWGSYGVQYAAVHEFGFQGILNIKAHTRTTSSGTRVKVRQHSRYVNFRPRPYIRPALVQQRDKIYKILKELL